ncbi:hypothetical protein MNB_SV-13-1780 [hydrothermal vent metagenome]|uniref:Type II secretion system protein M n=1 Tax=hydrothermal vent metagenome TaxID=652676 RepID=A0A1W1D195_9ZZZZ
MNIMTLQRYKNEIILLITALFAIFAFYYKISATNYVNENKALIQKQISEIVEIESYKKQWKSKNIANKIKIFKRIVSASKVKLFSKKSSKLKVFYINLNTNELNKITNKLLNMPVQIIKLKIKEINKNKFTMEFTCKW